MGAPQPGTLKRPIALPRLGNKDAVGSCRPAGSRVEQGRGRRARPGAVGGAAAAFLETKLLVNANGRRIIVAHVQPEFFGAFLAGMLHGALGESASDAAAAIIGMRRDVGNHGKLARAIVLV